MNWSTYVKFYFETKSQKQLFVDMIFALEANFLAMSEGHFSTE